VVCSAAHHSIRHKSPLQSTQQLHEFSNRISPIFIFKKVEMLQKVKFQLFISDALWYLLYY
jgi:hypothetical protein